MLKAKLCAFQTKLLLINTMHITITANVFRTEKVNKVYTKSWKKSSRLQCVNMAHQRRKMFASTWPHVTWEIVYFNPQA